MARKSLVTRFGEAIDQHLEDRATRTPVSVSIRRRSWVFSLLPTPGNVVFTLLIVMMLAVANRAGAININAPAATSTATIPYQGRLASASGAPYTGFQNMEFRLYAVPTGGTPLWTEYWTTGNAVNVSDGLFSVLLGSLTVNPSLVSVVQGNSQLWLGIAVGSDTEMTPRVQLGSAAYSMQALSVPDGTITTGKLAEQAVTGSKISNNAIGSAMLVDQAVTGPKIATGAISSRNMAPQRYSAFSTLIISSTLGQTPKSTQTAVSFTCATDCVALMTYRGLLYSSLANGRVDAIVVVDGSVRARGLANPVAPYFAANSGEPVSIYRQIPLAAGNHAIAIEFLCVDLSTCYYYGDPSGAWEGLDIVLVAQ